MTLDYVFMPIEKWPGDETPAPSRRKSNFDSKWSQTAKLLERETRHLGVIADTLTIMTFHPPDAITRQGAIRIGSRLPPKPGVVVSFEVRKSGKRERVQFECDRFTHWEDNVRAVALAMEALRLVDRFDVTSRGRKGVQYEGAMRALPPAPISLDGMSDLEAANLLCMHAGHTNSFAARVMENEETMEATFRQAARKVHPDAPGGSETLMADVNVAAGVLRKRFGK